MDRGLDEEGVPTRAERPLWVTALIVVALLCAWELLVALDVLSPLFFPPPSTIVGTCARLVRNGELPTHTGVTLARLGLGFLMGGLAGLVLGLVMGWSRWFRVVVDPLVAALHPMPKMALLPIFMILLGLAEAPKLAVTALGAFFPILINAMAGVRQISPIHFEVAKNYGGGPVKVFAHVVLPGSLPLVLAGLRLGFNSALHIVIAVELLTAQSGLGHMIWFAWETMRTEELYAAVTVTVIVGVAANALLKRIARHLVPWQTEHKI